MHRINGERGSYALRITKPLNSLPVMYTHLMMHTHQKDDFESGGPCVCTALRKASRAITRIYDDALAQHGVTTPQFAILRLLARTPGIALSRLAADLVMDRTTLYRALTPLERHGWIAYGAPDGRVKHASLTKAGKSLFSSASASWQVVQTRVTSAFGAEAWSALETQLASLTAMAGPS